MPIPNGRRYEEHYIDAHGDAGDDDDDDDGRGHVGDLGYGDVDEEVGGDRD